MEFQAILEWGTMFFCYLEGTSQQPYIVQTENWDRCIPSRTSCRDSNLVEAPVRSVRARQFWRGWGPVGKGSMVEAWLSSSWFGMRFFPCRMPVGYRRLPRLLAFEGISIFIESISEVKKGCSHPRNSTISANILLLHQDFQVPKMEEVLTFF